MIFPLQGSSELELEQTFGPLTVDNYLIIIINIIVQHVLTKMTSASETDSNDESDSDKSNEDLLADQHGSTQTFASAFSEDPIGRCCRLVVKLHSSGQHRDDFNNWVKTGNEKNWFKIKGKAIKLPHKDLLHDVPTCWDSTYQMIKRCIEMCPVWLQLTPFIFFNNFCIRLLTHS